MDSYSSSVILKNHLAEAIRYNQNKPFLLYINNNLKDDKCVIEFSAKILRDQYPELINKNTIHKCFENINSLNICKLDIDKTVNDSEVISMDITIDLTGIEMPDKVAIKTCLNNLNKYHIEKYSRNGLVIMKDVKDNSRKIRLSIYDKYKEINYAKHRQFLESLENKDALLAYFSGKFRIEANVKSFKQIRELCRTESRKLLDILNTDANPLLTLYDEVFNIPNQSKGNEDEKKSLLSFDRLSELKDALLLKACDNDLENVELVLNNYLAPTTNKKTYKEKYIKLLNADPVTNYNIELMTRIRGLIDFGRKP